MYPNRKKYKRYKKELGHTYALGPYVVFRALEEAPDLVEWVFYSPEFRDKDRLEGLLEDKGIPHSSEPKTIRRISGREDFYVIAVIKKRMDSLGPGSHLLLEGIDDMGNLGNILRSALAFGYRDLALLGQTCDPFHPRVIRASMGAFFNQRMEVFPDLASYRARYQRKIYAFRLDAGAEELSELRPQDPFTLAFGNEGAGLSPAFDQASPVFIEQNDLVDSLNLHTAVALACYQLRRT